MASISLLSGPMPRVQLAKVLRPDPLGERGAIESVSPAKHPIYWEAIERQDIDECLDLHLLLATIETDPYKLLCLGLPGTPNENGRWRRCLKPLPKSKKDPSKGVDPAGLLRGSGSTVLVIDHDSGEYPESTNKGTELETLAGALCGSYSSMAGLRERPDMVVQFSGSHVTKGCRAKVFALFEQPQLWEHLRGYTAGRLAADSSCSSAAQELYTAAPVLEGGVPDPLGGRARTYMIPGTCRYWPGIHVLDTDVQAWKALHAGSQIIRDIPPGGERHGAINRATLLTAPFVHATPPRLDKDVVADRLYEAEIHSPSFDAGRPNRDEIERGLEGASALVKPANIRAGCALSDYGNAERFVDGAGENYTFVPGVGWRQWDGRRWIQDGEGLRARKAMADIARAIRQEAAVAEPEEAKRLFKFALKSENSAAVSAALHMGESLLVRDNSAFDVDRALFSVNNGVVNLRTGELREHRRGDYLTKLSPFDYDPKAKAPRWLSFLEEVVPDGDVRQFLHRSVGYSATAEVNEQVLFFLHGDGSNGKSTFVELLFHVLGEYAKASPPRMLLISRNEQPWDLVGLEGARCVISQETPENQSLHESRVKQLTGNDMITARHMRKEFFEFSPTHKLWLCSNHRPRIRGTDDAIWRRIRLIPFTVTIEEASKDKKLLDTLRGEAEGILTWIVEGARQWYAEGLQAPAVVTEAVAAYRGAEDLVAKWLKEKTVAGPGGETSKQLFMDYQQWVSDQNERSTMNQSSWAKRVKKLGYESKHTKQGQVVQGLRLINSGDSMPTFGETGKGQDPIPY